MALDMYDWQDWVMSRWAPQKTRPLMKDVAIMSLGLAGETGEVVEYLKKYIRDGVSPIDVEKRTAFIYELGDVLHYLTRIAGEFDISMDEIIDANIFKLENRSRGNKVG